MLRANIARLSHSSETFPMVSRNWLNIRFILEIYALPRHCYRNIGLTLEISSMNSAKFSANIREIFGKLKSTQYWAIRTNIAAIFSHQYCKKISGQFFFAIVGSITIDAVYYSCLISKYVFRIQRHRTLHQE